MRLLPIAFTALSATLVSAAYPNPQAVSGSTNVHDPTLAKNGNTYYLLATAPGISIKTSTDMKTWKDAGLVWPNGQATWTDTYTKTSNGNLWAPDLSYRNGQFYLYYAASSFGSSTSAIYLATSSSGAQGTWSNKGIVTSSTSSSNYNAIDPNLFVDSDGKWWMTFGSFWSGIKQIRLDPSTGMAYSADKTVRSLASRTVNDRAIEAPVIYKRGSWYYLIVSFDKCCQGASSTYRIMVGRSSSVNGPFTDKSGVAMTSGGGTEILGKHVCLFTSRGVICLLTFWTAGHGSYHGPGGQSVYTEGGVDYLVYHYYDDAGTAKLGINQLTYDSAGWPVVSSSAGGSTPTTTTTKAATTTKASTTSSGSGGSCAPIYGQCGKHLPTYHLVCTILIDGSRWFWIYWPYVLHWINMQGVQPMGMYS
ncbi:hypothetical protein HDV00_010601 [Rhizophlyctis rosea]|nr:hypothetical protein HDV00_010601 [Rhizophlyctis rosea]